MKTSVSIVIVHWNTPEILKNQLEKLVSNPKLQIIVVDNRSRELLSWIKKDFSSVELVENKNNYGYAFACNQGVLKAKGDWLLFLNPDVDINPEIIRQLVEFAKKNKLNACSPTVGENYRKSLPSWWSLLVEFSPLHKFSGFTDFQTLQTLFGGCLLIKKEVIKKLVGWDERFFLWFEDSDLTLRLIKNNYKIGWFEHQINHLGGISFALLNDQYKKDLFFHSMSVFSLKHFSWFGKIIIKLIHDKYSKRKLLPKITNKVSITLPNQEEKLLKTFFSQNFRTPGVREEWIVVSSAINNYEVWRWREKYPGVRFIPIEKNYGFAHTVNIGFRVSTGKWIGTVNDDTILTVDWINDCLFVADNKTGSINPIIYKKNGKIETAGINILPYGKAIRNTVLKNSVHIQATNAAAVIYSKHALNHVGFFDERFGSYLEDIDLSLRLTRAGYKNLVSNKASIVHYGQQTSSGVGAKKRFMDFRNWIYIILKNWGAKKLIQNFPAIFVERLRNLFGIIKYFF